MPEIPVEDDPRVQQRFEFYTENPVGRETFQQMLFRCGAHKDMIQSALVRRGLPADLIAVVFTESGCAPLAHSPAGAEGLWQFIPEAARATTCASSRTRSTNGTARRSRPKLRSRSSATCTPSSSRGTWSSLVTTAGPFGILARLERVEGGNVGFWELVDAGMLPGETAELRAHHPGHRADLEQPAAPEVRGHSDARPADDDGPRCRPTLDAQPDRARRSALSVDELRRLNLDIKGFTTPSIQNFAVQVPKDSVWQARDTLTELLKSGDASDQCAPPTSTGDASGSRTKWLLRARRRSPLSRYPPPRSERAPFPDAEDREACRRGVAKSEAPPPPSGAFSRSD